MELKVTEITSESVVLTSNCTRYGVNNGNVSFTLEGDFNASANALKRNTLYVITATENEETLLSTFCKFVSYNCQHSISVVDKTSMVVTDNTVLFEMLA